jgi:hypothetical protein
VIRLAGIGTGFLKEARVVIEAWRPNPMVIDLVRRVQDRQVFGCCQALEDY